MKVLMIGKTNVATQYIEQQSKTIVNKVESKDVGMDVQYEPLCRL